MIMLLIACSAINTISADSTATPQKKAKSVIQSLEGIIAFHAKEGSQTLSVTKNPETGLIESSERIAPFTCKKEDLWTIPIGFSEDEPLSYQYMHLLPGNAELFNLKVVTNNGKKSKDVRIRTNTKQEMWFMCCKNPENPQLRDAYAIVWEESKDKNVAGTVFIITSLRPDIFEKNMSSAGLLSDNQNTFIIDGRVGYDLKDSLYVVYMADTAEELNNVKDSDFVATMPVVNKRFSFSVELDKRKVGRIRTVMPDGSLCHLWTNLDFVPGETYRITTHNGYYDEDRDYEQRVGRYSGKSLLNDLQRRGIDDQTVVVTDKVPEEFVVVPEDDVAVGGVRVEEPENKWVQGVPLTNPIPDNFQAWLKTITPQQKAEMILKGQDIQAGIERIKSSYTPLGEILKNNMSFAITNSKIVDQMFENIINQNKNLDKSVQEFQKSFFALNPPAKIRLSYYSDACKEILNVFTEQNKGFTEIYAKTGKLSKTAQKAQKYINKLTEKYMSEMMKSLH
jgi:hypothetical protein